MLFASLETMIQAGCGLAVPWVQKCSGGSIRVSAARRALAPAARMGRSHGEGLTQCAVAQSRSKAVLPSSSVQSQHGCACTPELLLVRSTQVHSMEMLEWPCAVPARFDTATRESEWRNRAKAPVLQSQLGASHCDPLYAVSVSAYPES